MADKHMASFVMSLVLLEDALHLPDGYKIRGMEWDFCAHSPRLYVEGPDLPLVPEGGLCVSVIPTITVTQHGDGTKTYTWKLK